MIALLSGVARRDAEWTVAGIDKIETAIKPRLQEYFVAAMGIPHSTHRFTQLAAVVDLPIATSGIRRRGPAAEGLQRRSNRASLVRSSQDTMERDAI